MCPSVLCAMASNSLVPGIPNAPHCHPSGPLPECGCQVNFGWSRGLEKFGLKDAAHRNISTELSLAHGSLGLPFGVDFVGHQSSLFYTYVIVCVQLCWLRAACPDSLGQLWCTLNMNSWLFGHLFAVDKWAQRHWRQWRQWSLLQPVQWRERHFLHEEWAIHLWKEWRRTRVKMCKTKNMLLKITFTFALICRVYLFLENSHEVVSSNFQQTIKKPNSTFTVKNGQIKAANLSVSKAGTNKCLMLLLENWLKWKIDDQNNCDSLID